MSSTRAGLLLYGLQIASSALPREPTPRPAHFRPEPVDELEQEPALGTVAPEVGYTGQTGPKSSIERIAEAMAERGRRLAAALPGTPVELHAAAVDAGQHRRPRCSALARRGETIQSMSDLPAKPAAATTPVRKTGLSPKEQKLQAMRDKLAHEGTAGKPAPTASNATFRAKSSFAGKKTAFQRKAT